MAHGLLNGMASWDLALWFLLSALLYSTIGQTVPRFELEPEFLAPLENHTVTQGRDVSFTCVVNHLQSYKVAWIKSDSRAILAMHTHMVAPNPRLSVTHNGHNTWKLHVVNVQPDDSGTYMCQVNTDPMRSQIGHMKVVIPPDIMDLDDSIDRLTSLENGDVRLRCRATGNPKPEVTWRREDGRSIILRTENGRHVAVKTHKSEQLHLTGIQRQEMGSYLCIASNGVPPSVSKRYYVNVLFKPTIKIRDQIVAAQINSNITLECFVESSPKSLTTWYTKNGVKVTLDERRIITENAVNDYTYQINLTIRRVRFSDFSTYTCFTENSFGKTNAIIRLKEKQNIKATSNPHVSRKKPAINSPIKGRKSHNGMNSINDPELSDKTRFEASFKDELSSLNDEDEENDEDEDGMPKHLDAKYSNFPAAPGAHYGSTDFPGSQYFNGATSTTGRFREAIAGCLAIFSLLVR